MIIWLLGLVYRGQFLPMSNQACKKVKSLSWDTMVAVSTARLMESMFTNMVLTFSIRPIKSHRTMSNQFADLTTISTHQWLTTRVSIIFLVTWTPFTLWPGTKTPQVKDRIAEQTADMKDVGQLGRTSHQSIGPDIYEKVDQGLYAEKQWAVLRRISTIYHQASSSSFDLW